MDNESNEPAVSMPMGPPPTMRISVAAFKSSFAFLKTAFWLATVWLAPPMPTSGHFFVYGKEWGTEGHRGRGGWRKETFAS